MSDTPRTDKVYRCEGTGIAALRDLSRTLDSEKTALEQTVRELQGTLDTEKELKECAIKDLEDFRSLLRGEVPQTYSLHIKLAYDEFTKERDSLRAQLEENRVLGIRVANTYQRENGDLRNQLASAQQENDRLREDKERLDWLIQHTSFSRVVGIYFPNPSEPMDGEWIFQKGQLRAAIDAARGEKP